MSYLSCSFQENPYNKDDDVMKATSFEVISTLREVLRTSSLWKDHVQTYQQVWLFNLFFIFTHLFFLTICLKLGIVSAWLNFPNLLHLVFCFLYTVEWSNIRQHVHNITLLLVPGLLGVDHRQGAKTTRLNTGIWLLEVYPLLPACSI
jgi:hypothetical protein